jgi:hypothetical protein
MTRQRWLKRRIRARMAKTGERYSTARRQVLKRLENGAEPVADQPEASRVRRRHPVWTGAVALVLAVALAGAIIVATQHNGGPGDEGPSTASRSENGRPAGASVAQCRRVGDALAGGVPLHFKAADATPRDAIKCLRPIAKPARSQELRPDQLRILHLVGREPGVREALASRMLVAMRRPHSRTAG